MKSEASRQFDNIYKEHHDPEARKRKAIRERRQKRAESIKRDLGL